MKELEYYTHIEWEQSVNKTLIPIVAMKFTSENINEWNEIYLYCKEHFLQLEPTTSGAFPNGMYKYNERFIVTVSNTAFELVIACLKGCYRFILGNETAEDNTISGAQALRSLIKKSKEFGVFDLFEKFEVDKAEGLAIKSEIFPPVITACGGSVGKEFDNCHHLDFNSSYMSCLVDKFEQLRPLADYLYSKRHDYDGYFKHVMTNSIGCMQSKYCIDIHSQKLQKKKPYSLSYFSKIAINGTVAKIEEYIGKLRAAGRKPLLINTDGIWYQGEAYHDIFEGDGIGKWKNDHTNCKLYIKSDGAYQYIEDGVIKSVVRGRTKLDGIKPDRREWDWREIDKYPGTCTYQFNKEMGVQLVWLEK